MTKDHQFIVSEAHGIKRRHFKMNTNTVTTNGFSNPESEQQFRKRFPDDPKLEYLAFEEDKQCHRCSFFAMFKNGFGLCCHPKSRHYTETTSEHFSCSSYVDENTESHSFSEDSRGNYRRVDIYD